MTMQVQPGFATSSVPSGGGTLEVLAADLVGRLPLDSTRERVCRAMVREALAQTAGNYSRAAELLGVKRQAVQQMVARHDLRSWVEAVKSRHGAPDSGAMGVGSQTAPPGTPVA
jgi:Bacterial regulatory protein, Fis family